jgi:hypothetical protein
LTLTVDPISRKFSTFADREAKDRSRLYFVLSHEVAKDDEIPKRLATLPEEKQQPNLVFAAYQFLYGAASDWPEFRQTFLEGWDEMLATILERSTQTNEPARSATLLPALARLPEPLALLELGASAGLCLIPDCYAFSFGSHHVGSNQSAKPVPLFRCQINESTPIPSRLPEIVWRLGIDINPINLDDPDGLRWLEACIWPDEGDRLALFREAIAVARSDPPTVARGDIRTDLAKLAARAPKEATLVVFHSATLSYLNEFDRTTVRRAIEDLGAIWISNESPSVLRIPGDVSRPPHDGDFLLRLNGNPIAWTDPHGTYVEWI